MRWVCANISIVFGPQVALRTFAAWKCSKYKTTTVIGVTATTIDIFIAHEIGFLCVMEGYTARNIIAIQLMCNLWVTWMYLKLINYTSSGYSKFQIYKFVILKDLRRTGWHSMHSLSFPFSWYGLFDIFSFVILLPVYSILLSPFLSSSPFGCSVAMQSISSSLRGLFIHNHNRCLSPYQTIDWPDLYIYTSLYKLMCVYVCVCLSLSLGPRVWLSERAAAVNALSNILSAIRVAPSPTGPTGPTNTGWGGEVELYSTANIFVVLFIGSSLFCGTPHNAALSLIRPAPVSPAPI